MHGELQQGGRRRDYIRELLNRIDLKADLRESLDEVIRTTEVAEGWRRLLVEKPRLIGFCGRRQIRFCSSSKVYLLKGLRRSGEHVELFSYQLYLGMLSEKHRRGELAPFGPPWYAAVHTDAYEPSVNCDCDHGDEEVRLVIWNNGNGYSALVRALNGAMPVAMKEEFGCQLGCNMDAYGNPQFGVAMSDVEGTIDNIVGIVRKQSSE